MKPLHSIFLISLILTVSACGGSDSNDSSDNENSSPLISLNATEVTISVGEELVLDASSTSDADNDSLTFSWSADVTIESPDSSIIYVSDLAEGTYVFTVTVTDGTDEVSESVNVAVVGSSAVIEATNLSTGSIAAPTFVYYDLETASTIELTETEAMSNDDWDIAFNRTDVYLNQYASTPVSLYFLNNVDAFYDDEGNPVLETFINATPSTELAAFENLVVDIPEDAVFKTDEVSNAISDFYIYDPVSHSTSANSDAYFVVSSDNALTKFYVTEIIQDGFGFSSITFGTSYQAEGESLFAQENLMSVDASTCTDNLYVDFDTNLLVGIDDAWDIQIPCSDGLADYEINIATDALVIAGNYENLEGIDDENFPFYDWSGNSAELLAIATYGDSRSIYGWGEYGVNGGHVFWPNYAAYVIQTGTTQYKFQVTNYYDSETGASGSYSIRYQQITTD